MQTLFICQSKKSYSSYLHQKDREFFSVPVEVQPFYCNIYSRMVYALSPLQGDAVYPIGMSTSGGGVKPCSAGVELLPKHYLSHKKLASARRIS